VQEGADIERFLRALHDRCWLAGLGWMMVGAGGQLLERSIIDRMVGAPERLVFEGPPVLVPPVAQDATARVPAVIDGELFDTVVACRSLSLVEQSALRRLRARERQNLEEDAKKSREAFVAEHAAALTSRTGPSAAQARQVIERQCKGILLPDIVPLDRGRMVFLDEITRENSKCGAAVLMNRNNV
jgi:hypothetical protein